MPSRSGAHGDPGACSSRTLRGVSDDGAGTPAGTPDEELEDAGLLDGLEGAAREERLELLRWLLAEGYPLEELVRASGTQTLVLIPSERAIGGRTRYTEAQVAEAAGVGLDFLQALERANGVKWAVLSDGKVTMYGKDGDTIDGRYRIVKIGAESVEVTHLDGRGRQVIRLTGQ